MARTIETARRWLAPYLWPVGASLVALVAVTKLWRVRLSVPFGYAEGGDLLYLLMTAKGAMRNGWYLHNPDISAPTGADLHDFPDVANLHLSLIKAIGVLVGDPGVAFNLFFLATFPLTAAIAFWGLRQLAISTPWAVAGAVLYAFLPGHFEHGTAHLAIATYFLIPIAVVGSLWLAEGRELWHRSGRWRISVRGAGVGLAIACLVISAGEVYFSFFAAFFLLVGGLIGGFRTKSAKPFASGAVLAGVLAFGLGVNLLPNLLFYRQHGRIAYADRPPDQAEVYALKLAHLVLPARGHRLPFVAALRERYDRGALQALQNENTAASLGAVGAAGFLLLLAGLLGARPGRPGDATFEDLAGLNLAAFVLATVGGFSSLFAVYVSPQIRAYGRISFFLGFVALAAVALVLDRASAALIARRGLAKGFSWTAAALVVAVGLFDQAPPAIAVPRYDADRDAFARDAGFVAELEAALPAGAMVFQLPYVPFPEMYTRMERATVYDPLRLYLASSDLRWSAGATYGRKADLWQRELTRLDVETLVARLHEAGFAGLCVDTFSYRDAGRKILRGLRPSLGRERFTSADKRWIYFDLGAGES